MGNFENEKYKLVSFGLLIAIGLLVFFVIIPKYSSQPQSQSNNEIDFSTSEWIEQYMDENVGIFGKDFYQSTAFSYNIRSNKMVVTYVSQNSVDEIREFYLGLPGAELTGRNDETSLSIIAENSGQILKVYNYYSAVARVIELDLTLDSGTAEEIIKQLNNAYPIKDLEKINEINDLISGKLFGGYVRYRYDNFDDFVEPNRPVFSKAFFYDGTEKDFNQVIGSLNEAYPKNKYDDAQQTNFYKISGLVMMVSFLETDSNENIVSISVQQNFGGE